MKNSAKIGEIQRPPVIVVMGHIDHGKSTLLDYIRKTNVVEKEAGGITQHISAYEVEHETKDGKLSKITFLDTPGHESFKSMRARGAKVADIAVLVVSAEDGVKPQTIEAIETIKNDKLPFVIAINKIDKPGANVDKTKQDLAENEVFVEGYGGNVPWVAISSKTGAGILDFLDLLLLVAELEEFKGAPNSSCEGIIIESKLDTKKGISATVIIKNGTLNKGEFAVSGKSISPLRIVENFLGKPVQNASFSSPLRIVGWDSVPKVGENFVCLKTKKEALSIVNQYTNEMPVETPVKEDEAAVIPIILKADSAGSLDAVVYELSKFDNEKIRTKIILSGIGQISENDIRGAISDPNSIVVSFHTEIDSKAKSLALRSNIDINEFDVIYKLTEWFAKIVEERTPRVETEEDVGRAKILKIFSKTKDKQIVGGRMEDGSLSVNDSVKIIRREIEIARGRIRELQQLKQKTGSLSDGEFGAMVESKFDIAPGDKIHAFKMVKK